MDAIDYRKKHKRCRYCKYCYTTIIPVGLTCKTIWECKAKDKTLDVGSLWHGRGIFCPVFDAEELKDE